MRLFAPALVLTLVLALGERSASAYCCTPASNNEPPVCLPDISFPLTQAWNQRCIPYWISQQGTLFDGEAGAQLIKETFAVWSRESCTDLDFYDAGITAQEPGFDPRRPADNQNIIIEINRDQLPLLMGDERLAATLTSYSTETGEIFDADILVNSVNFAFRDFTDPASCRPEEGVFDLRNMLVHEMGHFIGFDHAPEPESTMAATAQSCEVSKRDLAAFDLEGLCTVYAAGRPVSTCAPPANGYEIGGVGPFRRQCDRAMGLIEDESGCACTIGACRGRRSDAAALFALAALMVLRRSARPL